MNGGKGSREDRESTNVVVWEGRGWSYRGGKRAEIRRFVLTSVAAVVVRK